MDLPKGKAPDYDPNKDYYMDLLMAEETIINLKKELDQLKQGVSYAKQASQLSNSVYGFTAASDWATIGGATGIYTTVYPDGTTGTGQTGRR